MNRLSKHACVQMTHVAGSIQPPRAGPPETLEALEDGFEVAIEEIVE